MVRLLFITDYSEQFSYKLLNGIISYSKNTEPWTICKMPTSYKVDNGFEAILKWAVEWKADVVIGQFDDGDDVSLFRKYGIVAFAQDYRHRFSTIPNITSEYTLTGRMAARHFLGRGFKEFAFFGFHDTCWSDERAEGFKAELVGAGIPAGSYHEYRLQDIQYTWYSESAEIQEWLLSLPKPVAIMACDDNQGNILLEACNACGLKCPFDVAVIGVDDDEIVCEMSNPSLSSIRLNIEKSGSEVAKTATRMIRQRRYEESDIIIHPVDVVSRISSSAFAVNDPEILKAMQYIHQNLESKINVEDVLSKVPLSRRLLEVRFKRATGSTIYNYISRARMSRFAQLILESDDSITNIAVRMNETDTKGITRRFRDFYGCTPSEYRANHSNKTNWI